MTGSLLGVSDMTSSTYIRRGRRWRSVSMVENHSNLVPGFIIQLFSRPFELAHPKPVLTTVSLQSFVTFLSLVAAYKEHQTESRVSQRPPDILACRPSNLTKTTITSGNMCPVSSFQLSSAPCSVS